MRAKCKESPIYKPLWYLYAQAHFDDGISNPSLQISKHRARPRPPQSQKAPSEECLHDARQRTPKDPPTRALLPDNAMLSEQLADNEVRDVLVGPVAEVGGDAGEQRDVEGALLDGVVDAAVLVQRPHLLVLAPQPPALLVRVAASATHPTVVLLRRVIGPLQCPCRRVEPRVQRLQLAVQPRGRPRALLARIDGCAARKSAVQRGGGRLRLGDAGSDGIGARSE